MVSQLVCGVFGQSIGSSYLCICRNGCDGCCDVRSRHHGRRGLRLSDYNRSRRSCLDGRIASDCGT
jgi:hypothetical protein